MKRANNLYEDIYELNNLHLAYYKASNGKRLKEDVISFSRNLDYNLHSIQSQLIRRDVIMGDYHYFRISDPKDRLICAVPFRDRVLHHAIINVTERYFDNFQIYDSYACRKGKGVHRAVSRAFSVCKKHTYYLKLDVRKFFDNVDHDILYSLLNNRFKDKDLLSLFRRIIDSYETSSCKGIPIGNLTSQYFANFYLAHLDRFVKHELRIKDYIRYMDDFILFGDSMDDIHYLLDNLENFLHNNLNLSFKTPIINKLSHGFPFLGCRIYRNKILLSRSSKQRFKYKLIKYEDNFNNGLWDMDELISHINPLIGFTKISNSRNLRNYLINKYGSISV